MFLMIENNRVCPIEGFTALGVSTSIGTDKLGQFGSGLKYGLIYLLRQGLNPQIFLGENKVEFFTELGDLSGKAFKRVCYFFNGKREQTSMTLDWGQLDWKTVDMAVREFVSNAIDNSVPSEDGDQPVKLRIVADNEVESRVGYTRVFIPITPDIQKYYNDIRSKFLQFSGEYNPEVVLMNKTEDGPAKLYRRGAFVREIGTLSYYDYNFNELKIDECRNLNDHSAKTAIANFYRDSNIKVLENILGYITKMDKHVEGQLSSYDLTPNRWTASGEAQQKVWKKAFENCFGEQAFIAVKEHGEVALKAQNKGFKMVIIDSLTWYDTLASCGVRTSMLASGTNDQGHEYLPATAQLTQRVSKIWVKLESENLINNRPFPEIKIFNQLMDGESQLNGYWKNNTIYIEKDSVTSDKVVLEELGHHITMSTDDSRDFQDFAFRVATIFMAKTRVKKENSNG